MTTKRPPRAAPPAKARALATAMPLAVIAATAGIIAYAAWPTLRPVPQVHVTQAVFDRAAAADLAAPPDQPQQPRGTETTEPIADAPTKAVQAPGWLEAEPFFIAATALADGIIATIDVLEGDLVTKGQTVATLVPDDAKLALARAEANLAAAEAEQATAQAILDAAIIEWEHPIELIRDLRATRAAVDEARAELDQLPALIAAAQALQTQRTEEAARAEQSRSAGATNELELIIAQQQAAAAAAQVQALEARRAILKARIENALAKRLAAEHDIEFRTDLRRDLGTAQAGAALAAARVAQAAAARDEAALRLERMTVPAPITGYVQRRLKSPGDKIMLAMDSPHSAHVVHLYDPTRLQVRVDVPLADAAHIRVGQACEVVVDILPGTTFAGTVLRITHEADLQKNTLQAKVAITNPSPLLRPEMLARVKFLAAGTAPNTTAAGATRPAPSSSTNDTATPTTATATVLVPTTAIDASTPATPRVWLVTSRAGNRGTLRAVPITTPADTTTNDDMTARNYTAVSGAIAPGALVVTDPQRLSIGLAEGQAVRIATAPNTRDGAPS